MYWQSFVSSISILPSFQLGTHYGDLSVGKGLAIGSFGFFPCSEILLVEGLVKPERVTRTARVVRRLCGVLRGMRFPDCRGGPLARANRADSACYLLLQH